MSWTEFAVFAGAMVAFGVLIWLSLGIREREGEMISLPHSSKDFDVVDWTNSPANPASPTNPSNSPIFWT